jgi:excisionase family DNA binding protein
MSGAEKVAAAQRARKSLERRKRRARTAVQKRAFSVDETAQVTALSRDKLYDAMRDGALEYRKFGRRTLIMSDAIDRFLASLPTG